MEPKQPIGGCFGDLGGCFGDLGGCFGNLGAVLARKRELF